MSQAPRSLCHEAQATTSAGLSAEASLVVSKFRLELRAKVSASDLDAVEHNRDELILLQVSLIDDIELLLSCSLKALDTLDLETPSFFESPFTTVASAHPSKHRSADALVENILVPQLGEGLKLYLPVF